MTGDRLGPDDLGRMLDVWGADLGRWPQDRRQAAERLLAESGEARRLLAEARCLDAVLARASEPDPARLARLADRIVGAARSEAAGALHPDRRRDNVVPLTLPRPGPRPMPAALQAVRPAIPRTRSVWPTAGVLAASLGLGLLVGSLVIPPTTVSAFDIADRDTAAEQVVAAVQADLLATLEEDLP